MTTADRLIDVEGCRLRCRIEGADGTPVLLLMNALGTTLELWDALVPRWTERFRVVRFDARGHGGSTPPAAEEATLARLGADALAVLDAAGAPTAHVAGISIGALTGLWLAVHAPARVRTVVAANTAARVGSAQRWLDRMALVRTRGLTPVADMAMTTWFTPAYRDAHPDIVARFHGMVSHCSPAGYLACCAALRDADLRGDLSRITAPTLVIAGALDSSTPLADSEQVAGAIPGATLAAVPSAHLSAVECAEAVAAATAAFWDRHATPDERLYR